jgi:hypothetical protein
VCGVKVFFLLVGGFGAVLGMGVSSGADLESATLAPDQVQAYFTNRRLNAKYASHLDRPNGTAAVKGTRRALYAQAQTSEILSL